MEGYCRLTKVSRTTRTNNLTLHTVNEIILTGTTHHSCHLNTYNSPTLENNRLLSRSAAESESADCLSTTVLESIEHFVQSFQTKGFHE